MVVIVNLTRLSDLGLVSMSLAIIIFVHRIHVDWVEDQQENIPILHVINGPRGYSLLSGSK